MGEGGSMGVEETLRRPSTRREQKEMTRQMTRRNFFVQHISRKYGVMIESER
jgi:hypothetical protein